MLGVLFVVFFFKQKTAYEMRISDWSSDVCSSDLPDRRQGGVGRGWRSQFALSPLCERRQCQQHYQADRQRPLWRHRRISRRLRRDRDQGRAGRQARPRRPAFELGGASCRERVGLYVLYSVVAGYIQKQPKKKNIRE